MPALFASRMRARRGRAAVPVHGRRTVRLLNAEGRMRV
jgi:hypothetical protein